MAIPIFLLLVTVPAVLLVCRTEQRTKRGCGRGCATCGNREICHPGEKRRDIRQRRKERPSRRLTGRPLCRRAAGKLSPQFW